MRIARNPVIACLFFQAFLLCGSSVVSGAEPERGRLTDGRAFRTDTQGNQLVDYIAELELSVDTLNRRVQGLEDEVISRQQIIDRISSGKKAEPTLGERDILTVEDSKADSFAIETNAGRNAEALARAEKALTDLETQRRACEQEKADCRSQAAGLRAELTTQSDQIRLARGTVSSQQNQLRADSDRLTTELRETRTLIDFERERCAGEVDSANSRIAALEKNLRARGDQVENLETDFRKVSAEAELLRKESDARARMASFSEGSSRSRVPLESERTPEQVASPARLRALEAIRGSISTELNQIGTLILTRDRLVAQYGTKTGTLSFRPSATVSQGGLNVNQIRSKIGSAASVRELSQLRQETSQIKNKMQEDIALIKRMFNVR